MSPLSPLRSGESSDFIEGFRGAMQAAGIEPPPEITADATLHRFHIGGDRPRSENGWYILHPDDPPAGAFGCWKRDISKTWSAKPAHTLSPAEKEAQGAKFEAARAERERVRSEIQAEARKRAAEIWEAAAPAPDDHPYLVRKGVKAFKIRISRGALVLPLFDTSGTLEGLQFIQADGGKKYLTGTTKKGCFLGFGGKPESVIYLCEGYATGASIHQATGAPVAVAFDAGNLKPVAEALRLKFPGVRIVICGDNDAWTEGNPGATRAREAAAAVGGLVALPVFRDPEDKPTDFNDLARLEGLEEVRRQIEGAEAPAAGSLPDGLQSADEPPVTDEPAGDSPADSAAADTHRIKIDPSAPLNTAKLLIFHRFTADGTRALQYWQGGFYKWAGAAYCATSKDEIRAEVYGFGENAATINGEPFKPTRSRVTDIEDALRAAANLPDRVAPPAWLVNHCELPAAGELIACKNGLLHLPTLTLHPPNPAFFGLNALGFDYQAEALRPDSWLAFLGQLWPDDPEAIEALQDIFGYLLTADTSQQKIFLLVGPMRSGKGTIARILTEMIGPANVAGPTLASLAQPFGLATLIGKQVAVISDARLGSRVDQHAITERLLAISGEDAISIPRKYATDYTAKVSARFMILTNELPRLTDSSGALSSRFVILTMRRSFLGKEDPGLTAKLLQELPGILNWSIEGWQRLQKRGYFIQPKSSEESAQELSDLSSPISAFIRDVCEVTPAAQVECGQLYTAWRDWCEDQGREHPGTLQSFGRDLRAALAGVSVARPRQDGGRVRVYTGIGLRSSMVRDPDYCTRRQENKDIEGDLYSKDHNASGRGPSRPTVQDVAEVLI